MRTPVVGKPVELNVIQPIRVAAIDGASKFKKLLQEELKIDQLFPGLGIPVDDKILTKAENSPLAQPIRVGKFTVGNRFAAQPMEGWDGTVDGKPTELVERRWKRFGAGGAKLIWCEATAVHRDFRANPNQLCFGGDNHIALADLRKKLVDAHIERFGNANDLLVGIQLTHSGRFCKPNDNKKFEPRIAYHHPILDKKFGIDLKNDAPIIKDKEIPGIIDLYVKAAKQAYEAGFQFVDVKACHGYLLHEFLSAFDRPAPYGGKSLENRSRILCEIIQRIRNEVPGLMIGVRLSAFDFMPFKPDPERGKGSKVGPGIPEKISVPYPVFGANRYNPLEIDLREPIELIRKLTGLGVEIFNITAGSPYYDPHIQRPAVTPPSDGYLPPEDPLIGCFRQIDVVRKLKAIFPNIIMIGTAYTALQEFAPHVAQFTVRENWADFAGFGRMMLSYPHFPADVLEKGGLDHKLICRTLSDCTTGPRSGLVSGCYPLDKYYDGLPDAEKLQKAKEDLRERIKQHNEAAQAKLIAAQAALAGKT